MSCDQDAATRHALDSFRDRLKRLIEVQPLLDQLHFLEEEQKDRIKASLTQNGNMRAVSTLIDEIIKIRDDKGWSRELIAALETVGCKHAAHYVENNPPDTTEELENDSCIRLIDLMRLSLVNMKTRDVSTHCFSLELLTQEDVENVSIYMHKEMILLYTLLKRKNQGMDLMVIMGIALVFNRNFKGSLLVMWDVI